MMRKYIAAILVAALGFGLAGCSSNDEKQRQETERIAAEAHRQTGMPGITNFQERKLLKQIYELRDSEKLVCYAYNQSMDGKLVFMFKTLGYGIPYSTQFTNPERVSGGHTLKQPEPNGLWMPDSAEATWLLAIGPDGKAHPVYTEPRVVVSPFPLPNAIGNPKE